MKFLIRVRSSAIIHIEDAADWFQNKQEGLEIKFLKEIDFNFQKIARNPDQFQIKYKNVRVIFLKKFDFGIHYIIDKNVVHILAVFHTSQSPDKWL